MLLVGHCHPAVTKVACQQISELYTNNRYLHDNLSSYVYRLLQLFPDPLEVCFLCNSGYEIRTAFNLLLTVQVCPTVVRFSGSWLSKSISIYALLSV